MRLFHARLSSYRICNEHQTTIVTTTSHRSRKMGMKTEHVTVKLTSEMRSINLRLLCLDEMRRIYFHARLLPLD
jgi:hypothetical protein